MSVGSFSASLSGMNVHQQKLSVIGNNLANLNTVGFKASIVQFSDLVSQSIGGASDNRMQIGLGVSVGQISPNFSQGGIESTGISTNVAIQGTGFFMVGDTAHRAYTRAGNFSFDANGQLITTVMRRHRLRWWTPGQLASLMRGVGAVNVETFGDDSAFVAVGALEG